MKIIFRAFDGEEFCNQEECEKHEELLTRYKMWDQFGRTDVFDLAKLVHIPSDYAVERFRADCRECGIIEDGIEGSDVYIWDKKAFAWSILDNGTIKAIEHFLG